MRLRNRRQHHNLSWQTTFDPGTGDGNTGNFSLDTIVNVIPASLLSISGNQVRVTFEASSAAAYVINKAYISQVAASGDAYDSHSDIAQLLFSGGASKTVSAGTQAVSDILNYSLDESKPLIISTYVAAATTGNMRFFNLTGMNLYYKVLDEAATQNRSASYSSEVNLCYGIAKIEVFA